MGKTYMMADIHGSYIYLENFVRRMINNNGKDVFSSDDKMIIMGDVGANYFLGVSPYAKADKKLKNKLSTMPFTIYCVRGNHEQRPSICAEEHPDDWEFVYDEEVSGNVYIEKKFPKIKYFNDDPETYIIDGYNTLVMGGAYSVDKFYRLAKGLNWFEDEQMTEHEMNIARMICDNRNWNIDLVLTHTCPICFEPTDLFIGMVDQNMVDKSMERFFGEIEYKLNYMGWCWGHYHAHRDYPRDDSKKKLMLYNEKVVELSQFMTGDTVITL